MTNQNKNDSLSLYNAIVNDDFKEIQEYKNSIKVLENLKENDVTFEVINEVYNDQFKVANELNVLKTTFDILKSRSRNLKNTNKELKFINQVQGLDFKNKSINSIRNEINSLVDDAISLNHYDQEMDFNNPFVNLHSYLTSFANQIDRDFVATPYFEEWRTEPTPVDVRNKVSAIFNQPRLNKINEHDYTKRLEYFKGQLTPIKRFYKNANQDEWIKWINSLDHTYFLDDPTKTFYNDSRHTNEFLRDIFLNHIVGSLNDEESFEGRGLWKYMLYDINTFDTQNLTNEELNARELKHKMYETTKLLYELMQKYGFSYFNNYYDTLWGYDSEFDEQDETLERHMNLLESIDNTMKDNLDSELSKSTLFKKPLMYWKTLLKLQSFSEETKQQINDFINYQNQFSVFTKTYLKTNEFLKYWEGLKNNTLTYDQWFKSNPINIFDEYITHLQHLKQSYENLYNNEETKYLIINFKKRTDNKTNQQIVENRFILDNFSDFEFYLLGTQYSSNPIQLKEYFLIDNYFVEINEEKITYNQRIERIIQQNKIYELLLKLKYHPSFIKMRYLSNPSMYSLSQDNNYQEQIKTLIGDLKNIIFNLSNFEQIISKVNEINTFLEQHQPSKSNQPLIDEFTKNKDVLFDLGTNNDQGYRRNTIRRTSQGKASMILFGVLNQFIPMYDSLESNPNYDELKNEYFKPYSSLDKQGWLNKKNKMFEIMKTMVVDKNAMIHRIISYLEREIEWLFDNFIMNPIYTLSFEFAPTNIEDSNYNTNIRLLFLQWFYSDQGFSDTGDIYYGQPPSDDVFANVGIVPLENLLHSNEKDETKVYDLFVKHWEKYKTIMQEFNTATENTLTSNNPSYNKEMIMNKVINANNYILNDLHLYETIDFSVYDNEFKQILESTKNNIIYNPISHLYQESVFVDAKLLQPKNNENVQDWGVFEYIQSMIPSIRLEQLTKRLIQDRMLLEQKNVSNLDWNKIKERFNNHNTSNLNSNEIRVYNELKSQLNNLDSLSISKSQLLNKIHLFEYDYIYFNYFKYTSLGRVSDSFMNEFNNSYNELISLKNKDNETVINDVINTYNYLRKTKYKEPSNMDFFLNQIKSLINDLKQK